MPESGKTGGDERFFALVGEVAERPIEQWQNKTAVQSYFTEGWETFRSVVKKNGKGITAVDVQSRAALERLKGEYERSTAVLAPILRHLQTTDSLIDQIVYRLYGLTEGEIAIVERKP